MNLTSFYIVESSLRAKKCLTVYQTIIPKLPFIIRYICFHYCISVLIIEIGYRDVYIIHLLPRFSDFGNIYNEL